MIHQFIFAAPKPGMSPEEFQRYWIDIHAVRYASKIPQIRQYLIDARVPFAGDLGSPPLPHQGIAEIWLSDEKEQLESLQTEEFLHGARLDEPNWAAFWLTLVLDTTAYEETEAAPDTEPGGVKLTVLTKRAPGLSLESFREQSLGPHATTMRALPGVRRYLQAHTKDGFYVYGEASFDRIDQLWFDDTAAATAAAAPLEQALPGRPDLHDPKYIFSMLSTEHWIIGPGLR